MESFIEEYKKDLEDLGLSRIEIYSVIISYINDVKLDLERERMHLISEKLDNLYKIIE